MNPPRLPAASAAPITLGISREGIPGNSIANVHAEGRNILIHIPNRVTLVKMTIGLFTIKHPNPVIPISKPGISRKGFLKPTHTGSNPPTIQAGILEIVNMAVIELALAKGILNTSL
jgi:hypothetical protein